MKILLGVTGSISCYKSFDLTRLFIKAGHQVRIVLSKGASAFIKEDLYRYLGAQEVYLATDDFNQKHYQPQDGRVLHIELANWADLFVVAPLSANTLSNFCQASAQDLMQSIFLALPEQTNKIFFPAMNTKMLKHPFVQENVAKLKSLSSSIVFPTLAGELACGEVGEGKLLDIHDIFHLSETFEASSPQTQKSKRIVITTGATVAPLDPVRYLTNSSSGKTGFYLAKEALKLGHQVSLIAGVYATNDLERLSHHPNFSLKRVKTNQEMKVAVAEIFPACDVYISSAAIGDLEFDPNKDNLEKLKKSQLGDTLPIKRASDILKEMIDQKKDHQKIVGFAAETVLSDKIIQEKMNRKPVDLLVATQVHSGLTHQQEAQGFATNEANYRFMKGHIIAPLTKLSKRQLATSIFDQVMDPKRD
jgi:phosphopantothenoylcysteine decarboxylase/phosphopantothenate--cysteine ligase